MGDATISVPSKANDGTNAITQRARPLRHRQIDKNVTDRKTILTGIDLLSCGNILRKESYPICFQRKSGKRLNLRHMPRRYCGASHC